MKYVMMLGTFAEGFVGIGPFEDRGAAIRYRETEQSQENCWIVELYQPATLEKDE